MDVWRFTADGNVINQNGLVRATGPRREGPDIGVISSEAGDFKIHNLDWIRQTGDGDIQSPCVSIPGNGRSPSPGFTITHGPAGNKSDVGVSSGVRCHVHSGFTDSVVPRVDFDREPWNVSSPSFFGKPVGVIGVGASWICEGRNRPVGNREAIRGNNRPRTVDDRVIESHSPSAGRASEGRDAERRMGVSHSIRRELELATLDGGDTVVAPQLTTIAQVCCSIREAFKVL